MRHEEISSNGKNMAIINETVLIKVGNVLYPSDTFVELKYGVWYSLVFNWRQHLYCVRRGRNDGYVMMDFNQSQPLFRSSPWVGFQVIFCNTLSVGTLLRNYSVQRISS